MGNVAGVIEQIQGLCDAEFAEFQVWFAELIRTRGERFRGNALGSDVDRAWLDEVQRRSAEFDAGLMEVVPAAEVFAQIRTRLER